MAKATDTRSASTAKAAARGTRSAAETETIRVALVERRDELQAEYDQTLSEITELQRDRLTDSAGDDQADTGTKTFEREQEITLANNLLERITQVERAIERLGEGHYGWCERCGNAIPVERLAAFPSATLCVPVQAVGGATLNARRGHGRHRGDRAPGAGPRPGSPAAPWRCWPPRPARGGDHRPGGEASRGPAPGPRPIRYDCWAAPVYLSLIRNSGAAFSLGSDYTWVFPVITIGRHRLDRL